MNGLYIHIPFCTKRCIYCDFYSTADSSALKAAYADCVCREMVARASYLPSRQLQTIYLGGGTPSQLQPEQLCQIFDTIFKTFDVDGNAEITLEANPDDLTPTYVRALHRLTPINRVSMGIQTFNDSLLQLLNRRHTAAQARKAVSLLQECGFENLSIDLIYGLPGQSLEQWADDVTEALSMKAIRHLSAYALSYEEGTPLWQLRKLGKVKEATDELSLSMYRLLMDKAQEAGFEHYEISNFARPGFTSRHNSSYWQDVPYLGIGAAAHSYDGCSRQWNKPDIKTYIQSRGGTLEPVFEREILTKEMKFNETLLKRLRTSEGLNLNDIERNFGARRMQTLLDAACKLQAKGLVSIDTETGYLRLTKSGIFVSDAIIRELFLDEET